MISHLHYKIFACEINDKRIGVGGFDNEYFLKEMRNILSSVPIRHTYTLLLSIYL